MDKQTLRWWEKTKDHAAEPDNLVTPPPIFLEMDGQFLELDLERKWIKARFPIQERWLNPMRVVQGGMMVTAIDNTIGPLSYMVAPPSATVSFEVKFLRPAMPNMAYFIVEGWVVEQTRKYIYLSAKALSAEGKTLVMCQSTCQILNHMR